MTKEFVRDDECSRYRESTLYSFANKLFDLSFDEVSLMEGSTISDLKNLD